jgi:hypothetical protein
VTGPSLPDIGEAVALAADTSAVMSQAARLPYYGQARNEVQADAALGDDDFEEPVAFTHTVAGVYLLAAGDFVHGMHAVLVEHLDLAYSSGALARSATEYVAKAWWLTDPALTVEQRVARAVAALRQAVRDEDLLAPEDAETRQEWVSRLESWASRQTFPIKKGIPKASDLVEGMSPELGRPHYRILSGPVHGGVVSLMRTYESVMGSPEDRRAEDWFRVLLTTERGLMAAQRTAELRGGTFVQLQDMALVHRDLAEQCEAWRRAHSS